MPTKTGKHLAPQVEVLREGIPDVLLQAQQAVTEGQLDRAVRLLNDCTEQQVEESLARQPERVDVMLMMGMLLFHTNQHERAEVWLKRALQLGPHAAAFQQLAFIYHAQGAFSQATDYRLRALECDPENRVLWVALGCSLMREGRLGEGIDWLYRAVEDDPGYLEALNKLLFHLHYVPGISRSELHTLYGRWQERFAHDVVGRSHRRHNADPERQLRIAYLSGDLKRHSVAYTCEAIITGHTQAMNVTVYSLVEGPDVNTQRVAENVDCFRDIAGWDVEAIVEQIRRDRIDILVVMAGDVDPLRLAICARRPAPIQLDWGSTDTTATKHMDGRLADPLLDPLVDQAYYYEALIPLSQGSFCYRPPDYAPPVGPLPVERNGYVTFGSCNNNMKINAQVVRVWAQVLKYNPEARLLLKFAGGDDPRVRGLLLQQFEDNGIPRERLTIRGWASARGHLATYAEIDIALDTFPFNGAVTTLEALWMGVPVIVLKGDRFVGRTGEAILTRLGFEQCIASEVREYVARATALAQNKALLTQIRDNLRPCLANSSLCDAASHSLAFEDAYRSLWRQWCDRQNRGGVAPPKPGFLEFSFATHSSLKYEVDTRGLPSDINRAVTFTEQGAIEKARALLHVERLGEVETWLQAHPDRTDVLFLLGLLCRRTEQPQAACQWYQRALAQEPHPFLYFELAGACRDNGDLAQAITYLQQGLNLDPDSSELKATLADYTIKSGRQEQGLALLREVVTDDGDPVNHSKYLWHLHQEPTLDAPRLFDEHRRWAELYAPCSQARTKHGRDRNPERPLRIGYMSGDFCSHSVAYFLEPLLEAHDREGVTVYGYGNVPHQDLVTERLQGLCDHYRNICGQADKLVEAQIEDDAIDILVDLSGHTGENRLRVLAAKPAPIQVSFIGYPDTTGMTQVDYRFTDRWTDDPSNQAYYTERLLFLGSGFNCYRPPEFAPRVGPLPAETSGYVTFGSFNNSGKINTRVLDLWARVLLGVPKSQLLMKFGGGDDRSILEYYLHQFAIRSIPADRIRLVGRRPVVEHLNLYNEVDIALDTFPYHGTTTTCEALWMGVPVVSLIGSQHVSRVGLSLLARVGLDVFAAGSEQEYVEKAVAFGGQVEHLTGIRKGLRGQMWQSPLCDKQHYARSVEEAYRNMWLTWLKESHD